MELPDLTQPRDVCERNIVHVIRDINRKLSAHLESAARASRITATKTTIEPKTAKSFRMHAGRRGVRRMAELMRARGYTIEVALEVLVGRKTVRPLIDLEIA